jgi:cellulose synthase/poly-beta-1,6-N-acetylglucosamine synthase-like glycosyltransferase
VLAFEIAFWTCVGCVLYPYVLYPALLAAWARLRPRPLRPRQPGPRSVSIVVAAHNEELGIDRRLAELTRLLEGSGLPGELILVSDGSTDATAALARAHTTKWVRVVELPQRVGKAAALTCGCAEARYEVLVFTDMRQSWAPDALERLLENFADPDVGAVSGDLVVVAGPGALAGVGLYWRFEKWLRRQESRAGSQVGVSGSISAVRRELFRPIPPSTILDDLYWPLAVALQGKRVVHDSRALAYDRLPERAGDEFRRKVRTLAGNFQLATRLPAALLPWRNPVWLPLLSRKLLRLAVPWALLALLALSLVLPGWPYRLALGLQLAGYAVGLFALVSGRGGRIGAAAGSFLVLNAAAWSAFWVWLTGRAGRSWQKVSYAWPGGDWWVGLTGRAAEHGPRSTCTR